MCIDKFRVRFFLTCLYCVDDDGWCLRFWGLSCFIRGVIFVCVVVGFVVGFVVGLLVLFLFLFLLLLLLFLLLVVGCYCWLLVVDCWLLIVVVLCIAHYEMHIHHSRGMCCIMLLGSQRPREVLFGHIGRQTDVSWNMGTPKSSILIELSIINHPAIGVPTLMETTQVDAYRNKDLTKLDFWLVSSSKMFAMLLRQQASKQCSCLKSGSQYTTLRWAVGLAN